MEKNKNTKKDTVKKTTTKKTVVKKNNTSKTKKKTTNNLLENKCYKLAEKYYKNKDYENAYKEYLSLCELFPKNKKIYKRLIECLTKDYSYKENSKEFICYFSEIYRGGIESVPQGQYEACQVLGMTKTQTFFKVILMQVVKHIVPPMSNEIITLVKDTSLSRTIAIYEIIWNAQSFAKSDGLMWPFFYTGAFYLIFNGLLTVIFGKIEKKLDYYHN